MEDWTFIFSFSYDGIAELYLVYLNNNFVMVKHENAVSAKQFCVYLLMLSKKYVYRLLKSNLLT